MTAAFTVPKLLEHAGARLVSNRRANCPRCGTKRTVSYTDEVFNCHHAGCDFKGNVFTLAKELGLAQRIPHSEIQRQRREREHVRRQGEDLAERIGERVKALARAERVLHRAEDIAHRASGSPGTWEVLAAVYDALPRIRAEWTLFSFGAAIGVMQFLADSPETRLETLSTVLVRGGVEDEAGRFVEVPG